jgi:hypothetical protein
MWSDKTPGRFLLRPAPGRTGGRIAQGVVSHGHGRPPLPTRSRFDGENRAGSTPAPRHSILFIRPLDNRERTWLGLRPAHLDAAQVCGAQKSRASVSPHQMGLAPGPQRSACAGPASLWSGRRRGSAASRPRLLLPAEQPESHLAATAGYQAGVSRRVWASNRSSGEVGAAGRPACGPPLIHPPLPRSPLLR